MTYFSFIVPVYNVEKYLENCVDSILKQSYKDFEIILVDDGSTDSSGSICDKYAKCDSRIKVIHTKNQGLSKARNNGLEIATGKYVIFLDSDDCWVGDKLGNIHKKSSTNNADLVVFNYETYDESLDKITVPLGIDFTNTANKVLTGEEFLEKALEKNPMYAWYAWLYVIKRELLIKNKLIFEVNRKYEDIDLMYQIILAAKRVVALDEIVLNYRFSRQGSITCNVKLNTEKDKIEVLRRNIKNVQSMDLSQELKKSLCNNFSCIYYSSAILCNDIKDKDERKQLQQELKDTLWVGGYTTQKTQKATYYLAKTLGIKATCSILHFRKQIRRG